MNQRAQEILSHPSYNFSELQGINGRVLPPSLGDKPRVHSSVITPDGNHMPRKTPTARLHCTKKFRLLAGWLQKCYLSLLSFQVKMQGLICWERNLVPNQRDTEILLNSLRVSIVFLAQTLGLADICSLNFHFGGSVEKRKQMLLCYKRRFFAVLFYFVRKRLINDKMQFLSVQYSLGVAAKY